MERCDKKAALLALCTSLRRQWKRAVLRELRVYKVVYEVRAKRQKSETQRQVGGTGGLRNALAGTGLPPLIHGAQRLSNLSVLR